MSTGEHKRFRNLPIRKKLTRLILLISGLILLVTSVTFFIYDYYSFKRSSVEKLSAISKIIATNSTAAIAFSSKEDAREILAATLAEPSIEAICIYDMNGRVFVQYPEDVGVSSYISPAFTASHDFGKSYLEMLQPVKEGDKQLGTLYVKYDLSSLYNKMKLYALVVTGVILISFLLVLVFSNILQASISTPVLSLANAADVVSRENDYTVRVKKVGNDELGKLTDAFNHMLAQIESQNEKLNRVNSDLQEKAEQLEQASKYKSEFLANMSHELRSPLNSLLILANDLANNKQGHLDGEEVQCAEIIHESGFDLLNLINDILDLSKIESGKMEAHMEAVNIRDVANRIRKNFLPLTRKKELELNVRIDSSVPPVIQSDEQKLNQILKNLLSNAVKFTEQGKVEVVFSATPNGLVIDVSDTGIGIPKDKQQMIFEAFKQAEGGTSRRYGGTGLGLSIATQLARLLNGQLSLRSIPGHGSTFTLTLSLENTGIQENAPVPEAVEWLDEPSPAMGVHAPKAVEDDRNNINEGDHVILIIEDDIHFAKILRGHAVRRSFKAIIATTGEEGLEMAGRFMPGAIILDLKLPGISGLTVLGELKINVALRHIPVHIISAINQASTPVRSGIVHYLTKPVKKAELELTFDLIYQFVHKKVKNLLVVEDEAKTRMALKRLFDNQHLRIFEASTYHGALELMKQHEMDCMVLDLMLPDGSGEDLIEKLREFPEIHIPPVIVYTGKDLGHDEVERIKNWAEKIIIKGARSDEELIDEATLQLHQPMTELSPKNREIVEERHSTVDLLKKKKVLMVDDDMRNIFALSRMLTEHGMEVVKADSGEVGLQRLKENPDVDIVLMDIMMPEMDGYEAIRRIRDMQYFKSLPIIALTAKAMKSDRQKCLDAGANDYFAKPVDIDKLLNLMRLWVN